MKVLHDLPYYRKSNRSVWPSIILMLVLYVIAACICLTSCSTVTPNHVQDRILSADSSTPRGIPIDNNGWLGWHDDTHGIITANKRTFYNNLIADYRLQYRETYKVELKPDDGLEAFEMAGTTVYLIDLEHLKALARLKQWQVDQRPNDSAWLKILNRVGL